MVCWYLYMYFGVIVLLSFQNEVVFFLLIFQQGQCHCRSMPSHNTAPAKKINCCTCAACIHTEATL